ncbi:molecular chaperone [Plasmopara halstedii]|uniref:Molecular chaperone n=1 Tax=Plasmopara halstedii TaxID=4781 RepID=A0A0P1AED4_PLAHL|nr:molecular chaperone [Plasmopara halstedii]CEG39228.1 molecular chaperone [Plasmopara halstedii]|eukprot:XP_024575597.1 molecular chaperone [Plasmopara halstedii]
MSDFRDIALNAIITIHACVLQMHSADRRRHSAIAFESVNVGSLLLLTGGILLIASALLARQGFTGRDHVVGIDLGTTYSVVAIFQKNNVTAIADNEGHVLVPSTVAYLPDGGVLIGREARTHRTIDPQHTIFNAKRFIGQSYDDVIKSENGTMPYEFNIKPLQRNEYDGICFALNLPNHPECVTPVEIGTAIVRHLHFMAHRYVGHNQVTKAVVAVPVDFNEKQRNATKAAFRAAGLEVSRVLEEPTAAAIAYGLHQDQNINFMLVFDFGGGTLDVSLLFARNGAITVVDTLGDNHLGGEDLDARLSAWLLMRFESQLKKKISTHNTKTEGKRVLKDRPEPPCTMAGVRQAAELLKRQLTNLSVVTAACVWNEGDESIQIEVDVTRLQFEELCKPLLERTMIPVRDILAANNIGTEEIDAVVLVGGSSRIPWVRQRLTEMFHGRAPLSNIDPDLAVAYGAARTLD